VILTISTLIFNSTFHFFINSDQFLFLFSTGTSGFEDAELKSLQGYQSGRDEYSSMAGTPGASKSLRSLQKRLTIDFQLFLGKSTIQQRSLLGGHQFSS
jgi:hypothetical protein